MRKISGCNEDALGWGEALLDVEGCCEADYAGSVWLEWVGVVSGAVVVVEGVALGYDVPYYDNGFFFGHYAVIVIVFADWLDCVYVCMQVV